MSHSYRPPNRLLAYGFLASSMALVGSYIALSKPLVAALPVFLLAWMRFGIAGVAMFNWLKKPANEAPMSRQTKQLLFLESFLGNFMFSICMLFGVSLSGAVAAGVIMAATPAVVALMSWILLKEQIGVRIWAAVACAAVGIGLLALSHGDAGATSSTQGQVLLGNLLLVGSVFCEGFYSVIGKKLTVSLSPKRISALINLCGFLLMTPLGLYTALHFNFAAVQLHSWALLVFYALAASIWSVWLWMTGLQNVPAAHAGVFSVLMPLAAAVVGVLVLGEPLSGMQMLAFAVALLGVLLATLPGRRALSQ